jgi:hypothetical protein
MAQFGDVVPVSDYHYAVAAIGLRLMQAIDLTESAQARSIGSILWAARAVA